MNTSKNPSLSNVQRWMRWTLTRPEGVPHVVVNGNLRPVAAGTPWTRGPEPSRCLHVIGETPELSRVDRLAIYGDGYFLRLIECLASNYDSLKNVVGENAFADLARAYLVRHPSTYKCIDNVGHQLSEFLIRHPLSRRFPFLPDLAELEWSYHQAFYSNDQKPLDKAVFAAWTTKDWLSAHVTLDPSARLLLLDWPVRELWRADGKWPATRLKNIRMKKTRLLVFKNRNSQVRVADLDPPPFQLLTAFQAGTTFGLAIKKLAKMRSLSPNAPGKWLANWVSLGLISGIRN